VQPFHSLIAPIVLLLLFPFFSCSTTKQQTIPPQRQINVKGYQCSSDLRYVLFTHNVKYVSITSCCASELFIVDSLFIIDLPVVSPKIEMKALCEITFYCVVEALCRFLFQQQGGGEPPTGMAFSQSVGVETATQFACINISNGSSTM